MFRITPYLLLELKLERHPLEHPLPLERVLVRRAQELDPPLNNGAQLGDRLGLEGVRVLRPPCLVCVGRQRAQLLPSSPSAPILLRRLYSASASRPCSRRSSTRAPL